MNGKTVRMSIKVATEQDASFEAFVKGTEERIPINGENIYPVKPQDNADEATLLVIPESVGKLK